MSDEPPKYTCWKDGEDITAAVLAERERLGIPVAVVAAKATKVVVLCPQDHENVFEF